MIANILIFLLISQYWIFGDPTELFEIIPFQFCLYFATLLSLSIYIKFHTFNFSFKTAFRNDLTKINIFFNMDAMYHVHPCNFFFITPFKNRKYNTNEIVFNNGEVSFLFRSLKNIMLFLESASEYDRTANI